MTKIVCISDTHGDHDKLGTLPMGEVLIHSGDCTDDIGKASLRRFCQWFQAQPHPIKIFIAGNHDGAFQRWPGLAREMLKQECPDCHYLEDSTFEALGLKFYGSPWTPTFMKWHFMADPGAIKAHWDKIPNDTDVLITHGPPRSFLDLSNNWNQWEGKKFDDPLGCADLKDALYRVKPKLHVFGHIHGSGGRQLTIPVDGTEWGLDKFTILVNASIMDENYMLVHKPVVVEL